MSKNEIPEQRALADDIWCVIPVYNNSSTVLKVALDCRKQLNHVLVVDDGSTDTDIRALFSGTDIPVLTHPVNLGKGAALMTALDYIHARNGVYMLTIDADGQHYPNDIPLFIQEQRDDTILIGSRDFSVEHVPGSSKFGRRFSNFWFRIETGIAVDDTQSGFRLYPVKHLSALTFAAKAYDWEVEVLVRAAWAGLSVKTVPVQVYYTPKGERISHFRPFIDNLRLSLLHSRLIGRVLMPMPHAQLVTKEKKVEINIALFKDPRAFFKILLVEHATPAGLAAASFVSIFLAVLPLLSVHMVVILYVISRLHLNRVMALAIQNICMPPFVPVLCAEVGHYLLYHQWITEVSLNVILWQLKDRIWEWFIGSLIVAPFLAMITAAAVYFIAAHLQKEQLPHAA